MSTTPEKKDSLRNDLLSPVSKLEKARMEAKREQQKRIEERCLNSAVKKTRNNQIKRKKISNDIEYYLKKKRAVDASEGMLNSKEPVQNIYQVSEPLPLEKTMPQSTMKVKRAAKLAMASDEYDRMHVNWVEGGEISSAIQLDSEGKENVEMERELLMAKKEMRSILQTQSQDAFTASTRRMFMEEDVDGEFTKTVKRHVDELEPVNVSSKLNFDVDEDEMPVSPRSEVSSVGEMSSTRYWKSSIVCLSTMVLSISYVLIPFMLNTRFCDTTTKENNTLFQECVPCPEYGVCQAGSLLECAEPFVMVDGAECVQSEQVQQDAARMSESISNYLTHVAKDHYCSAVPPAWYEGIVDRQPWASTHDNVGIAKKKDIRGYLRSQDLWASTPVTTFEITLAQAIDRVPNVKVHDASLEISIENAPLWCQYSHLSYQHRTELLGIASLLSVVFLCCWLLRSRSTKIEYRRLLLNEVYETLKAKAKSSHDEIRSIPVDHLRDHVFDEIETSRKERKYILKTIWPLIVGDINQDSRVRKQLSSYRGSKTTHWEWVSPDLPSNDVRRNQRRSVRQRNKSPITGKSIDLL